MRAGIFAEYADAEAMLAALRKLRELGYRELDAYSPYPVHGSDVALARPRSRLPLIVLAAGLTGALTGYLLQWWTVAVNYPLDVGGRPPNSPLAAVPIAFEMGVLFAGFAAVIGLFALCGLPRLWHPCFEVPGFDRATVDRFWISVDARDRQFDRARTAAELADTGALQITYAGRPR